MFAKVTTCAVIGLDGALVQVEVDISNSALPAFLIVGLPDTAVQEAKERVRAAIKNSGGVFPQKRIIVSLAPADLKKEGPAYDLPMAVGVLLASEQVETDVANTLFLGELGLDGTLRHTDGVLPMVAVARQHGLKRVFVPACDAAEAALLGDIEVIGAATLRELVAHLRGEKRITPFKANYNALDLTNQTPDSSYDFSFVKGQEHVKRAMEVAAAGQHNLLMSGSPGSGKTLLARTMVTILPSMDVEEALEVTKIYSVSGLLPAETPLMLQRPFRAPHHTISNAGLVGGGRMPRPGEITLAHRGILFLDEIPEFGQPLLDNLRQPLEDRILIISRASGRLSFPANFILIAAMNPCLCGWYGDERRACSCSPSMVTRYQKRLSGPLLDRIDIRVEVPRVEYEKLADNRLGEPSAKIRERVEKARQVQRRRFENYVPTNDEQDDGEKKRLQVKGDTEKPVIVEKALAANSKRILTNGEMGPAEVRKFCQLDDAGNALLKAATRQLNLSARSYTRILKLSRTIADLAGSERIQAVHVAEAIQYRPKEQV